LPCANANASGVYTPAVTRIPQPFPPLSRSQRTYEVRCMGPRAEAEKSDSQRNVQRSHERDERRSLNLPLMIPYLARKEGLAMVTDQSFPLRIGIEMATQLGLSAAPTKPR
jgi:hypothetical protein